MNLALTDPTSTGHGTVTPFAAGVLTRVSTPGQANDGVSLANQADIGRRVAAQMGVPVVDVYEDAGISGDLFDARPDLQRALSDMRAGRYNVLIVHDQSRLSWNPQHLPRILHEIELAGGALYIHLSGQFVSPDDHQQEMVMGVQLHMDRWYRKHLKNESRKAKRKRATDGVQVARASCMCPFGYHIVSHQDIITRRYPEGTEGRYIALEAEADLVRSIYRRYLAGESLRAIARSLTSDALERGGMRPPRAESGVWSVATVQNILSNPVYKGEATFGAHKRYTDEGRVGQVSEHTHKVYTTPHFNRPTPNPASIIRIACPPIIAPADWDEAAARREENKQSLSGRNDRKYLLSGLMVCPECGSYLQARTGPLDTWEVAGNEEGQVPERRRRQRSPYHQCRRSTSSRMLPGETICSRARYRMDIAERLVAQAVHAIATRPDMIQTAYDYYLADEMRASQSVDTTATERRRLSQQIAAVEERRRVLLQTEGLPPDFLGSALREMGQEWTRHKEALGRLQAPAQADRALALIDPEGAAAYVSSLMVETEAILLDAELPLIDRHRVLHGLISRVVPRESPRRPGSVKSDAQGRPLRDAHDPASPCEVAVHFRPSVAENAVTVRTMPIVCTVTVGGHLSFRVETPNASPAAAAPVAPDREEVAAGAA